MYTKSLEKRLEHANACTHTTQNKCKILATIFFRSFFSWCVYFLVRRDRFKMSLFFTHTQTLPLVEFLKEEKKLRDSIGYIGRVRIFPQKNSYY